MREITVATFLMQTMEDSGFRLPKKYIKEALEVERKQMEDAWYNGYQKAKDDIICDTFSTFDKYYNETYSK